MRSFVLVVMLLSPAAHAYQFLGWHPSGAFYFQTVTAPVVQVCREDTTDVPTGWPEGTAIGPGVACADLPTTVGEKNALEYAKAQVKGAKAATKSQYGLELKLAVDDKKHIVSAHNGGVSMVIIGDVVSDVKLKIAEQFWHPDGNAVVVVLRPEKREKGKDVAHHLHKQVPTLLVGGPAGRKLSEKKQAQGVSLYKKRDWNSAGKSFEEAIAADPDWAAPRYWRAAAEAQGGVGRTAMIENLQWLKEHADEDKLAKRLLTQARDDEAFDAWVGEPEVRELIGLPSVSTLDVPARLLERKATWTLQGATCSRPWITIAFKKGGNANVTVAESCKGKKTSKSSAATYKATAAGPFELDVKKPLQGVPAQATLVLDESYQQLQLKTDAESLGPFEPGAARIDDSTL